MRGCGALALAIFASGLLGCATVDVEEVPPCGTPESLQPLVAVGECDEGALAGYVEQLVGRTVKPANQALVRVELDEASRVRSVCVDEGVGAHAWHARRHLASNLAALRGLAPGPACTAGRRLDLNRYQAKLAETEETKRLCGYVRRDRIEAPLQCEKYPADWILYRRVGSFWPHIYLRSPDSRAPVADTATECGRKHLAFEALSACILSEGFQLLRAEDYEVAVQR